MEKGDSGLDRREPARVLGLVDASSVVIGAIIGVGIFFTPARVAALVKSDALLLLAWGIAGGIALTGAFTFAELGARKHGNGAQYEVLREAYGPLPAFLYVFCNATAIQAGTLGIIAVICVQNGVVALGRPALPTAWLVGLSCMLIVGTGAANAIGVRWGARIQRITVVSKILTLVAIGVLGVFFAGPRSPAPPIASESGGAAGVLSALVPAIFALGGFQTALWIAGEVREPARTLPRAILGGVLLVIVLYMLANVAYVRLLGDYRGVAASRTVAADAVAEVAPSLGGRVVAGAVGFSAFGVLNAQILAGPRLCFGMARDGLFFRPFAALHPRFGTPWASIALSCGMAIALLALAGERGVDRLLTGVVFIDGFFFALTGAALFVLRRRGGAPGFLTPGYPFVPALFVLGQTGVVIGAHLDPAVLPATLIGAAWIVVGVALYFARFRGRAA